jgi:hypothetical protein
MLTVESEDTCRHKKVKGPAFSRNKRRVGSIIAQALRQQKGQ